MSASASLQTLAIASWLFCLHGLLILGVYILWLASSHDVERNMIWLWARLLDFPVAALEDIVNHGMGFPQRLLHSHRGIAVGTRWLDSRSLTTQCYSRHFSPWHAKHLTMRWSERPPAARSRSVSLTTRSLRFTRALGGRRSSYSR